MIVAGVTLLIIGKIWDSVFPINKNLWSSSFVCWTAGISLLLFAVFYFIIDVMEYKKWAFPLVVIGMNSITIYLAQRVFYLGYTSDFLFGGFAALFNQTWQPVIIHLSYALTCWLLLYWLYKKKIFLKI